MRIITGILLLAVICIGSHSCQKEYVPTEGDSTITTPPAVTGSFTAKIDGVQFVADKVAAATKAIGVIAITGQSTNGELIVLRVADSGVHVYSLDIQSLTNAAAYSKDNGVAYTSNGGEGGLSGGTLSITSIDTNKKTISGTFSIKVYRQIDSTQKVITEGIFKNISYDTNAIPPANSSDTFRVKANGADFPVFSTLGISVYNMINISASDQNVTKTVGISFPSDATPGVYTFTSFGPDYIAQYNIGNSYLVGESGTLTILENNATTKRVRGNFNFHASEILGSQTADLTEGYFSVVYQ